MPFLRGLPKSLPTETEPTVVLKRTITHIDPGPVRSVSIAPSTEGTLQEQLASYKRWARNHKAGFVFSRESFVLDIILELIARVEQLEGKV